MKSKPVLDDSLETQAVKFLKSVKPKTQESADAFLSRLATLSGDFSTHLIQSIVLLISSASQILTTAAIKMLSNLLLYCYPQNILLLIKADLIHQLIMTLNPLFLSFADAVHIHTSLLSIITITLRLATPEGLTSFRFKDDNEQQAVHDTVLKQVLVPSEKYIWHLCVNHYSIIDGEQSSGFMILLARLLQICPSYQPTMEIVLHMPVLLTISSCLTFFEDVRSIWNFQFHMNNFQRERNKKRGEYRQMWKTVHQLLRMEGIEDEMEEKLQNDKTELRGKFMVASSIKWNNMLGLNLP